MKELKVVPYGFPCSLEDCPVGLFLDGETLSLKTEYGNSDSYIIESGETYCGKRKLIQPCIVEESSK